jgi:hypothetical protein
MQATISKEQRHENILLSLKKLGFLSRSQIQKLHRLGGVRNTNRILKDMEEFLNVVRLNENVYYLNSEGRERVGSQKVLKKTHQITHHLLRNSLYISYGCPTTWQNEVKIKIDGKVFLIADAMFDMAGMKNIIEVDHTQKMNENRNKIKKYKHLLKLGVFQKEPKFIWVTTTEYRKKQILKACEGMKVRVYLASEFN